ncbi:MAG: TRASH domain-containing protein [Thermoplasmata archaeon]
MAKINVTKNEFKILRLLVENSRLSISELSQASGLNRNTVAKIVESLTSRGIIKSFTLKLANPDEEMLLVETDDDSDVPSEGRIETLYLLDGTELVLLPMSAISKVKKYRRIGIVSKHVSSNELSRQIKTYCDYCGKEIEGEPITFLYKNREYFACCQNCRSDLMRNLKMSKGA